MIRLQGQTMKGGEERRGREEEENTGKDERRFILRRVAEIKDRDMNKGQISKEQGHH